MVEKTYPKASLLENLPLNPKSDYPLNIRGHRNRVSSLILPADNQYLISASDKEIIIWNLLQNTIHDYVLIHKNPVKFITSPSPEYFISVSSELVCKWKIKESLIDSIKIIKSFGPTCIDSSQNYNLFALCSSDLIRILSLSNLKKIISAYSTFLITSVLFSTQSTLITGGDEGEIQIYSLDLQILKTLKLSSKVLDLALNQDFVTCSLKSDSLFAIFDLNEYEIKTYNLPLKRQLTKVLILNDLEKVVYVNKNFELVVFSLVTAEVIKSVLKIKSMISDFVISKDETLVFVGGFDKKIRRASLISNIKEKLNAHFSDINCTLIHGGKLFSCSMDKTLRVWSLESGIQENLIKIHNSYINEMKLLRGNNHMICYSYCKSSNMIIIDIKEMKANLYNYHFERYR